MSRFGAIADWRLRLDRLITQVRKDCMALLVRLGDYNAMQELSGAMTIQSHHQIAGLRDASEHARGTFLLIRSSTCFAFDKATKLVLD